VIHNLINLHIQAALQKALIDGVPLSDPARAGVISLAQLQGDPDPDEARISVSLFENDPDALFSKGGGSSMVTNWTDEVSETECGGSITYNRRFTVKARCLLVNTGEDKYATRRIASTLRDRIERCLLNLSFAGVETEDEYVSRGAIGPNINGEMLQAGGPPDSYDYHIKIRFDIQTTRGVTP
jgi:hypothetical protein